MSIVQPLTPQELLIQERQAAEHKYPMRCLVALDMFANVVLLNGRLDETISSHASRAALVGKRWGLFAVWGLNLIQKNHGADAQAGDLERAQAIEKTELESPSIKG